MPSVPDDQMDFLGGDESPPAPQTPAVERIAPDVIPEPDTEKEPDVLDPLGTLKIFDTAPDPTVLARTLFDEYVIPPFTVLDARQGYWQKRRQSWLRLNIKSEIGRGGKLTYGKFDQAYLGEKTYSSRRTSATVRHTKEFYGDGSTSVFDPVLTEIVYRWMCPPTGVVLDPFAGGSVRGIVASCLGRRYYGIELRAEQVEANRTQAKDIIRDGAVGANGSALIKPRWIAGDSDKVLSSLAFECNIPPADLVFTCPPYGNLEVYSDEPGDISNMSADAFDEAYTRILKKAVGHLANNRFAAVVISNIRDKDSGYIRDLVGLTNRGMASAGAFPYNEAVLLNVVGTGALRARKQFNVSRKLVRTHQFCLIYVKGDPRVATVAIGASE